MRPQIVSAKRATDRSEDRVRKVSALLFSLLAVAGVIAALALPAGAGSYPPPTTTPTTTPPTTTPPTTTPPTTTPPTTSATTSTSTTTTTQAQAQAATLAFTGSDSKPLVVIGIIAVAAGAVFVVAARRRSSVQAPKSH